MRNILQLEKLSKQELFNKIDSIEKRIEQLLAPDNNEKLSIKAVALEMDVSDLTVHNWIKRGQLKASKIGRRVYVSRKDLDEALQDVKSLKYKRD